MDQTKKFIRYILTFVVGVLLGIIINIPSCNPATTKVKYIPVRDTITIENERIIEHTTVKYEMRVDTFYTIKTEEKIDTVQLKDLPIEYKQYHDTITKDSTVADITIDYHGFASEIDSIDIKYNYFNKQEIIIQKPKKVGLDLFIGPYIGYGFGIDSNTKQFMHGMNVGIACGVGFGYRIK